MERNTRPIRILICRPNHRLGNLLLVTPIIQEVSRIFPNCKIDLFVKGKLGEILFRNYPNVDRIIQLPKRPFQNLPGYINGWLQIRKKRYDIAINVDHSSSSGRLSVQFSNSGSKVLGEVFQNLKRIHKDYEHHAKFPVYNFWNYLEADTSYGKYKLMPGLDLKLELLEIADGKRVLKDLVGNNNPTICLYTFATGKKCYPAEWWIRFYELLKANFPKVNIIEILPLHKASVLSGMVKTFYSTDVRQIGSVIANSSLFIGADSGIMHLASSARTPTVGLFSVTDKTRYEPYQNGSIGFNTNTGDIDECIKQISFILETRLINQPVNH